MKIGLLTLPFNNNYGGYLQCFALMAVLKNMGHSPEVIYRRQNRRKISWRAKQFLKRIFKKGIGSSVPCLIPDQEKELRYRGAKMMEFVDKYISPKTAPLYSTKDFYECIDNHRYDAVIVGSDQVWRPDYGPKIQDYFLYDLHSEETILISYAASFGVDNPNYGNDEMKECGVALSRFKAVSLREKSGVEVINRFGWKLNCCPSVVLDPTLLLNKESYLETLPHKDSPAKGKVFCYLLDPSESAEQAIKYYCNNKGIESYNIINTDIWRRQDYVMPSIEEWLSGINEAEFVITDSFHGAVFSILFNKDFWVFGNVKRGKTRFLTLLSNFGLEERFIDMSSPCSLPENPIEWTSVNKRLHDMRTESLAYLERALKQ